MIIFAGTSGALDDIPANRVAEFESAFLAHVRDALPDASLLVEGSQMPLDKRPSIMDVFMSTQQNIDANEAAAEAINPSVKEDHRQHGHRPESVYVCPIRHAASGFHSGPDRRAHGC